MMNLRKKTPMLAAAGLLAATGVGMLASQASAAVVTNPAPVILGQNPDLSIGGPITSGGSTTPFTFKLPASPGDECPGDTATDFNLAYGYVVPDGGTNGGVVATLHNNQGELTTPSGVGASLIDINGNPYVQENLAPTTGEILNIPYFNFSEYAGDFGAGDDLAPGVFDIGIACTDASGAVNADFNTQITFAASSSDPNGFAFTLTSATTPPPSTPESPLAIGLPLSAVAIAGASVLVLRRRRRTTPVV